MVQIENQTEKSLPNSVAALLQAMFADYYKVVVKSEFTAGLSGSRVFLVRSLLNPNESELPSVVKIDFSERIEQEWAAYQKHIRYKLPGVAEIRKEPVYLHDLQKGILWYPLVGDGVFDVISLYRYWQQADISDIQYVLGNRLFRSMGYLWRQNQFVTELSLATYYDSFLPVNLTIELAEPPKEVSPHLLNSETVRQRQWQAGDWVQLSGFQITEIERETRKLVLNIPPDLPGAYRLRLINVPNISDYQVGQMVKRPFLGLIQKTRHDILLAQAQKALGTSVDLSHDILTLSGDIHLPNPLVAYRTYLQQSYDTRIAYIHGDLHLENVLVEPESRTVALIDFAYARRDHLFRDFFHLEMSLVTRVVAETLAEANLSPDAIIPLYEQLYRALLQPNSAVPPIGLEKPFAILQAIRQAAAHYLLMPGDWAEYNSGLILHLFGSLKFKNLDSHPTAPWPKKLAILAAATVLKLQQEKPASPIIQQPHSITGTTPPALLTPKGTGSIQPGQHYLRVQISQAQAAYLGDTWAQMQRLTVSSRINLNYPALTPSPVEIVHGERTIKPGQIEQLGLTPVLVDLVPTMMPHITITITFRNADTHESVLEFSGNFNILPDLKAGHYAFLGTKDRQHPLPDAAQLEKLQFQKGKLYLDNQQVNFLSYVVLEASYLEARTRLLGKGTRWDEKLREAEAIAFDVSNGFIASEDNIANGWQHCLQILRDARTLLQADPHYLPREADDIYKLVATDCWEKFWGRGQGRSLRGYHGQLEAAPELQAALIHLGLDPYEDLSTSLTRYDRQVAQARRHMHQA